MTRKELESVFCLKKELRIWQERLAELQADIALSPKVMDGMPFSKTNGTSNPTEAKAIRLAGVAKVIEGKISEIQITLADIEEYIVGIDDPELRLIVQCRCIKCMTWERIGEATGYDRTTVSKKYSAYLDATFPQIPLD